MERIFVISVWEKGSETNQLDAFEIDYNKVNFTMLLKHFEPFDFDDKDFSSGGGGIHSLEDFLMLKSIFPDVLEHYSFDDYDYGFGTYLK